MSTLLNKLGLGTVQFGLDYGISNEVGKTSIGEIERILNYAKKLEIRYLDTAYAYGEAETVLGRFDLTDFRIISKYIPNDSITVEEQIEQSLIRMKKDSLYGYLAHRPLDLLFNDHRNLDILLSYKKKGILNKIGASFNTLEEIEPFLDRNIPLDIVQIPYNFLDRRFEDSMKILKSQGCEIHTRSSFLQGLFFCKSETLSSFFDEIKPILSELQKQTNLSGRLLRFVLEKEFIDVTHIGVNNLTQLRDNVMNIQDAEKLPSFDKIVNQKILMPSEWKN